MILHSNTNDRHIIDSAENNLKCRVNIQRQSRAHDLFTLQRHTQY